jgi:hypothetical protein
MSPAFMVFGVHAAIPFFSCTVLRREKREC